VNDVRRGVCLSSAGDRVTGFTSVTGFCILARKLLVRVAGGKENERHETTAGHGALEDGRLPAIDISKRTPLDPLDKAVRVLKHRAAVEVRRAMIGQ